MKRSLSASDLIAEGKRLSKPSLLLSDKPNGGAVVGYFDDHSSVDAAVAALEALGAHTLVPTFGDHP